MSIGTVKTRTHWNYFLAIERDLEILSRFVEFDERNFDCFSLEIARVLLAAGAETDVVRKRLCKKLDATSRASGINSYKDQLVGAIPDLPAFEVRVPRFALMLHPWNNWKDGNTVPLWWTAYNKIKHHRDSQYEQANLKNALNAISALFVVTLYLYREDAEEGELSPSPQLLAVGERYEGGFIPGGTAAYFLGDR